MIRLKPQRRVKISNRLALVGALSLALSTFPGFDSGDPATHGLASQEVAPSSEAVTEQAAERAPGKRGNSLSRLLFGRG